MRNHVPPRLPCSLAWLEVLRGRTPWDQNQRHPISAPQDAKCTWRKKTFFLTSPQDSDESSAFISVTRKFFCRFVLGIFFWSSLFSSYARKPSESSPRAVSRVESARGIRQAQGGGKEAKKTKRLARHDSAPVAQVQAQAPVTRLIVEVDEVDQSRGLG